jgi:hypothetical protein
LWFNVVSAAYGGWYLLNGAEGLPMAYLADTPFTTYSGPGWILLLAVGGSSLLAAISRLQKWSWAYIMTAIAGMTLFGWLMVEFIWIPEGWAPQLFYALVALPMVVGGVLGWQGETRRLHQAPS